MTDEQQQEETRPRGGYLAGTHDEVERLREQYIDGEIDEDELARQLTDDRLREHEEHKRRQRKAKRQWRLIGLGALLFLVVTFVWAQQTGVPL
jgi:hypothetical protein